MSGLPVQQDPFAGVDAATGEPIRKGTPALNRQLRVAAERGEPKTIGKLLAAGAYIDCVDRQGDSPLLLACRYRRWPAVRVLLAAGADPNIVNGEGLTALQHAALRKSTLFCDLLRAHGARGEVAIAPATPAEHALWLGIDLEHVARLNDLAELERLYLESARLGDAGADAHSRRAGKALSIAAMNNGREVMAYLLAQGVALTDATIDGRFIVPELVRADRRQSLEAFLDAGASVNTADDKGNSLLAIACHHGMLKLAQMLLHRGANPDGVPPRPPLHAAAIAGDGNTKALKIIGLLLDAGANPSATAVDGAMATHVVCRHGHHQLLARLLAGGADAKSVDADGCTPLHYAVRLFEPGVSARGDLRDDTASTNTSLNCVEQLLAAKVPLEAVNRKGLTPLLAAAVVGNASAVERLLAAGARCDVADENGNTALHLAAQRDAPGTMALLLADGVSESVANREGQTPEQLAQAVGCNDAVRVLRAWGARRTARQVLGQARGAAP